MRCSDCQFYEGSDLPTGRCRRYPAITSTTPGGWCGEYRESENAAARKMAEAKARLEAKPEKPKRKYKKRTKQ